MDGYHVRDVNLQGVEGVPGADRDAGAGRDAGHALGAAFRFDHRGLRNPPSRGTAAATVGYIRNPRACRARAGPFSRRLCHPPAEQRGFEGVSPLCGAAAAARAATARPSRCDGRRRAVAAAGRLAPL